MKKIFVSICLLIIAGCIWGCAERANQSSPEQLQTTDANSGQTPPSVITPTQTVQPTLTPISFEDVPVESFVELQRIHQDKISCFGLSPDGTKLAIARNSGIYIYDVAEMSYTKYWATDYLFIDIVWSPDNAYLASRLSNDTVDIWNVQNVEIIGTIELSTVSPVPTLWTIRAPINWSPDGTQFFAFGVIWNTKTWEPVFTIEHAISGVLWSPQSNIISTNHSVGWRAWTKTGKPLDYSIGMTDNLAWSPNGNFVAADLTSTRADNINVWDPSTGKMLYSKYSSGSVNHISWSPDGYHLAFSIMADNMVDEIKILNISTGEIEKEFSIQICCNDLYQRNITTIWSSDGKQIVTGHDDGFIRVWSVDTGEMINEFQAHSSSVESINWVENQPATMITSGGGITLDGGEIRIWNISTGKMLEDISSNTFVPYITWSSDSTRIMAGTNKTASIWNVNSGELEQNVYNYGESVNLIAWSPNGETFAYTEEVSDKVQIWNPIHGNQAFSLGLKYSKALTWSPTNNWLAASGAKEFAIYDLDAEEIMAHLPDGCHIGSVAWSFDGKLIAYGDVWGRIYIFDPAKNEIIQTIEIQEGYVSDIAWSPNGQFIAVADYHSMYHDRKYIQVYNAITGSFVYELDRGQHISWSPNGQWLATTTTDDNSIKIWNTDDPDIVYVLPGHEKIITDIKWSPDGTKLATMSYDGTIRIWGSQIK